MSGYSKKIPNFLSTVAFGSEEECVIWPFAKANGYGVFTANKQRHQAHRYVCETIYGPAPSAEHHAAHLCGVKDCVNPRHIRWATPRENARDKEAHGTVNRGERNGAAKLTREQVCEIRRLKGVERGIDLAARFGVAKSTISMIHSGVNWM